MARAAFHHHRPPWRRLVRGALTLLALASAPAVVAETDPVLGAPAAFERADTQETIHVDAGTAIHQSAAARAPILRRVDVAAELPLLDRDGSWAHVRFDGLTGWVRTSDNGDQATEAWPTGSPDDENATASRGAAAPPMAALTKPTEPPPALRPLPVDEDRVNELVGILGKGRQSTAVGGYTLWSDVTNDERNARLVAVLGDVDRAFAARYGIEARRPEREVVFAFADPKNYQTATDRVATLDGVASRGHTSAGIATLIAQGPRRHVDAILIHEVTHLIVRRALGGNLPTWLEEGLAEDLAYAHVDAAGRIDIDRLGRFTRQREALLHGGLPAIQERKVGYAAGLTLIRDDALRSVAPGLIQLLHSSFEAFVRSEQRTTHYAMAAHFVRYLLDGEDPSLRDGFRRYLQQVAYGESADVDALLTALGREETTLARGYEDHLRIRLPR